MSPIKYISLSSFSTSSKQSLNIAFHYTVELGGLYMFPNRKDLLLTGFISSHIHSRFVCSRSVLLLQHIPSLT